MAKNCKGIKQIVDGIFLIDYQVNRRRVQERIRASSLKEAKIIRQERIVELRKQSPLTQEVENRLNAGFDEALEKLEGDLQADGLPKKTLLRYKKVFQRVFVDFRKSKYPDFKSVSQINLPFLVEYRTYFVNDLKHNPNGGLRGELIIVKSMLRRLKRLGLCGKEIIEGLDEIKRPRGEKKMYPNITNSQIKDLLNFTKRDKPYYYYLIYFMCRTGRRIEETTLIERRDVVWVGLNPAQVNIRPETTKTKEDTPLGRLDDGLAKIIKEAYAFGSKHKTIYLFCNKKGKKCSSRTILTYLRDASKKVLGIVITPHYFRHRFLTECGKANVSLVDIMSIAGIKDINVVTKYYTHVTPTGQDKVLEVSRVE